ncbi:MULTISPECIES: hypothetical protein [Natrinema]|nr:MULTISPECIES: hypothetical protein [Natrinema]
MPDTLCPECLSSPCDVTDRAVTDDGLRTTFECQHCGHVWVVVF